MIGNFDVRYRVIDDPRGSLDLFAGLRYVNLYQELTVRPEEDNIATASANLMDAVGRRLKTKLTKPLLRRLISQEIESQLEGIDGTDPQLPIGPLGRHGKNRIRSRIEEIVESRKAELKAAINAASTAKTVATRAKANARADAIKSDLTKRIQNTLNSKLDQTFSRRDYWFDPILGLRGRFYLSRARPRSLKIGIGFLGHSALPPHSE